MKLIELIKEKLESRICVIKDTNKSYYKIIEADKISSDLKQITEFYLIASNVFNLQYKVVVEYTGTTAYIQMFQVVEDKLCYHSEIFADMLTLNDIVNLIDCIE